MDYQYSQPSMFDRFIIINIQKHVQPTSDEVETSGHELPIKVLFVLSIIAIWCFLPAGLIATWKTYQAGKLGKACMGGCVTKSSFTVNKNHNQGEYSGEPMLFCREHLERVLADSEPGEFLLYRDIESGHTILTVKMPNYIRHYKITESGGLYYMQGQPYPYLDSILLYHRRHKLNGAKLLRQAHISARDVRTFAHRVASTNGNFHLIENKNTTNSDSNGGFSGQDSNLQNNMSRR